MDPRGHPGAAGHLVASPAELEIRPGEWYQPDLGVVPLNDGRRPRDWNEIRTPRLVIEVSSPSTDPRPEILVQRLIWQPEGAPQPLEIDLVASFSGVLD